ncbi:MAG: hypothetical protein QXI19_06360, partial [Candidatus Caldarchaeum sp.]
VKHGVKASGAAVLVSNLAAVAAAAALAAYVQDPAAYLAITAPASAWLLYENFKTIQLSSIAYAWRSFKVSSPWLAAVFSALLLSLR